MYIVQYENLYKDSTTVYRASGCKIFMYENVDKTVHIHDI